MRIIGLGARDKEGEADKGMECLRESDLKAFGIYPRYGKGRWLVIREWTWDPLNGWIMVRRK